MKNMGVSPLISSCIVPIERLVRQYYLLFVQCQGLTLIFVLIKRVDISGYHILLKVIRTNSDSTSNE